jgi:anti-sigma-K factor RskA
MDYGRPDLADRLAAEYVLGTLRGPARRRFERLLPAHPALREGVAQWQARLEPLAASIEPVNAPPRVWQRIESTLFAPSERAQPLQGPPWWRHLGLWRTLSGLATAALVAVLVIGLQPPPAQAPIVVVLAANPDAAQVVPARFVASVSPDGRALVLRPIDAPALTAQQALELWAVPAAGAPRSLGLVKADGATTLVRAQLLRDTAAFAVSVEPAGGSPTGAPTGPIVSLGKLTL